MLVTVVARLDNRDELSVLLHLASPELLALSDESLVVRAFQRWGEACPIRLNGDWSLAVWNPASRRLFLARDHFGNGALYYARHGNRLAFASDVKALLSLPWVPRRLNDVRIASLLVGGSFDPEATTYRDISRLPPAHSLIVTPSQQQVARYWRVEDTPDADPSDTTEQVKSLRATLRAAVASRVVAGSGVGSMLSGGLDSGAVTAFAAEYLQSQGRRLTAFTSVPAFAMPPSGRGAGAIDEGPGAAALARVFNSIDHVLVPARTVTPVAGIRRALAILGEPSMAGAACAWITELMVDAQARGVRVLLNGQVGDFVMAGRPVPHSWRRDWSARRYRHLVRRLAPDWMLRLRQRDWKPWRMGEAPWRLFSVVHADLAAEVKLAERLRDVSQEPRQVLIRQSMARIDTVWAPLGAHFGLTVLDPLQDKRLMEQMFSWPPPAMAGATDRWLFRQSLVGVVPDSVRLSRGKGVQSADIVERLVASWAEVEEALALAEASAVARRCVDLPYCRVLLNSLRSPQSPYQDRRRAFMLVDGLAAALFLAEAW